jgi:ATPase subunit of ABC transporter with duplicated ATPase domains
MRVSTNVVSDRGDIEEAEATMARHREERLAKERAERQRLEQEAERRRAEERAAAERQRQEQEAAAAERKRRDEEAAAERKRQSEVEAEQRRREQERQRREEQQKQEAAAAARSREAEDIKRARADRKAREKTEREERARKAREADPHSPVVNGYPVKPRIATPAQYQWRHPSEPRSNFIDAHLTTDGTLSAAVMAKGPNRVGASELFDLVFEHFGGGIKRFKGEWRAGRFDTNFNEFTENLKTMSREAAAKNTWTGRLMASKGFGNVTVPPADASGAFFPVFSP